MEVFSFLVLSQNSLKNSIFCAKKTLPSRRGWASM